MSVIAFETICKFVQIETKTLSGHFKLWHIIKIFISQHFITNLSILCESKKVFFETLTK